MIVLDASVMVKWYAPEPDRDAADALLAGPELLLAPELARVEVAAALVKKARVGALSTRDVEQQLAAWCEALTDDVVQLSSDELDLPAATSLALELGHPLQDCLYLALALRLRARLVTADRRFATRAGHLGPIDLLGRPSASAH